MFLCVFNTFWWPEAHQIWFVCVFCAFLWPTAQPIGVFYVSDVFYETGSPAKRKLRVSGFPRFRVRAAHKIDYLIYNITHGHIQGYVQECAHWYNPKNICGWLACPGRPLHTISHVEYIILHTIVLLKWYQNRNQKMCLPKEKVPKRVFVKRKLKPHSQ